MKVTKQEQQNDCGLHVIQALIKHFYHHHVSIDQLRLKSNMTRQGLSLQSLIDLAGVYRIKLEAYQIAIDEIKDKIQNFFIALIKYDDFSHYIIAKANKQKVHVFDSINLKKIYSWKAFSEIFQGIILLPTKYKQKILNPYQSEQLWKLLLMQKEVLIWITITLFCFTIFTMLTTIFSKLVIDLVLPDMNIKLLTMLTLIFAIVIILTFILKIIKVFLINKVFLVIHFELKTIYMQKLSFLSYQITSKVDKMDLLRRYALTESVAHFMTNSFYLVASQVITFIVATIVICTLSLEIFALVLTFSCLIVGITVIFQFQIKNKYDLAVKLSLASSQTFYDYLMMVENLKNSDDKKFLFTRWHNAFEIYQKNNYQMWKLSTWQEALEFLIFSLLPIFITYLSVQLIFHNHFSLGKMIMIASAIHFFLTPLREFAHYLMAWPGNYKNLILINNIMDLAHEKTNETGYKILTLKKIELTNLTFAFDQPLIDIKNWVIDTNIHLLGKNGAGKSTLLKIIQQLYDYQGIVKYNDVETIYLDSNHLRRKILYISPESYLPYGSIWDYLTMGNLDVACKQIHKHLKNQSFQEILKLSKLQLHQIIKDNGANFSLGQRQIIKALRMFTGEYQLILVDEALENVDQKIIDLFKKIMPNILYIEVSRAQKYLSQGLELDFAQINQCI